MLYLAGIGISKGDISLKALEAVKKADLVYFENYTSIIDYNLEEFLGKKIIYADREMVESGEEIIKNSKSKNVAFLVVGDIFSATTHISLYLDAKKNNIKTKIIHGISILTVVSNTGLSLYNFGKVSSIPFENENVETPYRILEQNKGMHTLFLLDLDPKNKNFMKFNEGLKYLLKLEKKFNKNLIKNDSLCIACCGIGTEKEKILVGKAEKIINKKIDVFPQCLIIPGKLHFIEEEALKRFK